MKLIRCFASVFLGFILIPFVYSQEGEESQGFNYTSELNKMIAVPNSPEAQAFTQYGEVPVNLYEGAPNVSVPLYTFKGLELDLPINLTYDMNARKVEDMATNVGLGWNLNLGGRVSRIVKGNPDDYIEAGGRYMTLVNSVLRDSIAGCKQIINNGLEFDNEAQLDNYLNFLLYIQKGIYDTELDYYSINALSVGGYVTMDMDDFEPHALDDPKLKVSLSRENEGWFYGDGETFSKWYPITDWHVTDGQGNEYYFELSEETISEHENDISSYPIAYRNKYSSSWVLTKIVSKNQRDIYEFGYTDFGFWTQFNDFPVSKIITKTRTDIDNYPISAGQEINPGIRYAIKQQYLTQVKHNGKVIVAINLKERHDYNANQDSAIDYIQILEPVHQKLIFHYQFDHSYFGISEGIDPTSVSFKDIRLKLDAIKIGGSDYDFSSDYVFEKQYTFGYNNASDLPSRTSSGQDVLGFYNGYGDASGILYPKIESGGFVFDGANRSFSESYAKIGILESIKYPTEGITRFEYEQHQENVYEETSHSVPVVSVAAYSDQENQALCGSCCLEAGQAEVSDAAAAVFEVSSEGNYEFLFTNDSGGLSANTARRAFVIGPYSTAASIPNVTVDDFLCGPAPPLFRVFEGNHNNNLIEIHTLSPGHYKIFAYNLDLASPPVVVGEPLVTTTSVGLSVSKLINVNQIQTKYYPGLRVKSIANYESEDMNSIVSKKNYLYKKDYGSQISGYSLRGEQMPTLSYFLPVEELIVDPANEFNFQIETRQVLHRLAKPIMRSGSNVSYRYVIEENEDVLNTSSEAISYVKYEFETLGLKGFDPTGLSGATSYSGNFKKGKLKSKTIHGNSGKISSEVNTFKEENVFITSTGFAVVPKSENNLKFLTFYNKPNGKIGYFYQHGVMAGFNGEAVSGIIYQTPQNCNEPPNIKCLPDSKFATLDYKFIAASGRTGGVSNTTKTSYFPSGSVTQETNNIYSSVSSGFLLEESKTTNSKGDELRQSFFYPKDLASESSVYSQMVADNQLTVPVEIRQDNVFKNQIQRYNYIAQNSGFYISDIQTAKNSIAFALNNPQDPESEMMSTNNPLEERIHYEYYSNGNIKSSYQSIETDDLGNNSYSNLSTYIWGYNNSQLIAKIDNASYAEVQSYVSNLQTKSNLDNDHCREVTCKEEELRVALNTLRIVLPNALVTTYTYDPMIGVTSITDPRGQAQYFEYDEFHRLKHVKDSEGNILSKNEYHYKSQN